MPASDYDKFEGDITPGEECFWFSQEFLGELLAEHRKNAPADYTEAPEDEIGVRISGGGGTRQEGVKLHVDPTEVAEKLPSLQVTMLVNGLTDTVSVLVVEES